MMSCSRYSPGNRPLLATPVNVSRSSEIFSWLPRVVIDPRDPENIYILRQEIIFSGGSHGGEILFACSNDGGRSLCEPLNLSHSTAGAGKGRLTEEDWHNASLDLAVNERGELYAAWTEYQGPLRVAFSRDGREFFVGYRQCN